MIDFTLSRGETSTILYALIAYKQLCMKKIKQAQKNKRYIPRGSSGLCNG